MTKVISMLAIAICMVSANVNAQEKQKEKETAKKEVTMKDKKSCGKEKKGGCCAAKKAKA